MTELLDFKETPVFPDTPSNEEMVYYIESPEVRVFLVGSLDEINDLSLKDAKCSLIGEYEVFQDILDRTGYCRPQDLRTA